MRRIRHPDIVNWADVWLDLPLALENGVARVHVLESEAALRFSPHLRRIHIACNLVGGFNFLPDRAILLRKETSLSARLVIVSHHRRHLLWPPSSFEDTIPFHIQLILIPRSNDSAWPCLFDGMEPWLFHRNVLLRSRGKGIARAAHQR